MLSGLHLGVTRNQINHSHKQKPFNRNPLLIFLRLYTIHYVGMDVTVATLIWTQWASEDYSTVGIVTSSCMLCRKCFTSQHRVKPKGDEQLLGRVQQKINKNVRRLHKSGGQNLKKMEQADLVKWVGNLLSSGLIGLYGKPTKRAVVASMKKYLTFFPHQPFQDWFHLFCTGENINARTLFQEINHLQERLGLNFRTSYDPTQVLCIDKYKIDFRDTRHPSDLRVVLLLEKKTGYICSFYIYSITQVLRQTQCIPFLYIIRKLLIPFCKRNYTVQLDSSAHINQAVIEEFNKLGLKLQLVSRLGGNCGSAASKENNMDKPLRDYVNWSCSNGYSIFPVYGRDYDAITFLAVFWLLVYFSCINAFILNLLEYADYGEGFSLKKFVKLLSQEILGNNAHSGATRWEGTASDKHDMECEAGATATDSRNSLMKRKDKGVTGLCNLGNTCYMNAVIQCLSCTSPMVEYFFSWQFEAFMAREKKELLEAFSNLMTNMWFGKDRNLSPVDFLSVMRNIHPPFGKRSQQDAQEFLIYTLNALHEDLTKKDKKRSSDNAGSSSGARVNASESPISRLLQGVLKQTTTCLKCGQTNHRDDTFTVLSLPIASADETSLQECLECFFQQVTLTKMDKIFCSLCKTKQDTSVKGEIWKLPKILILHLKRFEYKGHVKRKLKTNVDFPLNNLDVSPFLSSVNVKHQKYKLYAVVNHFGELDYGHYTAFCKHPGTKEWNAFDDIRHFRISELTVQTSSAYILFYTNQTFSCPKKTSSCSACC
ncbi:ubiquitin carboxyl-terminal hydrolase 50 isoform X2 [Eleutherodactylus coqui]|uniref:ubiquitin carboxyl-terminal hydrolase 50 isoform X2 n=1 Tax=Eleutherodactylus coqui TaxID=57060 RepID=UPI003461F117